RDWDPRAQAEFLGPLRRQLSGDLVGSGILPFQFVARSGQQRIDFRQKALWWESAQGCIPHPLVAHGANAALHAAGIGDSAKGGGDHVAVLERAGEFLALFWIVTQPVEKLGKSPLGGVDSAAPLDGLELFDSGELSNQ